MTSPIIMAYHQCRRCRCRWRMVLPQILFVFALCTCLVTIVRFLLILAADPNSNNQASLMTAVESRMDPPFPIEVHYHKNDTTTKQSRQTEENSIIIKIIKKTKDDENYQLDNNDHNNKNTKPQLYLHMGPHKTGSTTIQKFVDANSKTSFRDDGYLQRTVGSVGGTNDGPDKAWIRIVSCLKENRSKNCPNNPVDWDRKLNIIFDRSSENMNIFLSNEELAHVDIETNTYWHKLITFLQQQYHIHIILIYRRYHDWILSYYNQHYKYYGPFGWRMNVFVSDGGIAIQSFPSYWNQTLQGSIDGDRFNTINQWDYTTNLPQHDCLVVKRKLQKQGLHVIVVNLHSGSLLPDLFCDTIPNMSNTCDASKKAINFRSNTGVEYFDADMIAVAAHEAGLIPKYNIHNNNNKTIARRSAIKKLSGYIRKRMKKRHGHNYTLPLVCLTKEQQDLLYTISYHAERELMPSLLPSFNESFDKAIQENKFCNVDTTQVLQDPIWRSTLPTLKYD